MRTRHDALTQVLHWTIALLVTGTFILALVRDELPRGELKTSLLNLHMSVGVLVILLTLVRLAWRPFAPRVAPLEMSPMMHLAARLGHLALYVALLAVPLVGLLTWWARGRGVDVFGLVTLPSPLVANRELAHTFEEVHEVVGNAIMILAGLHALAAILHQVVLRDGTLGRMLPFLDPGRDRRLV